MNEVEYVLRIILKARDELAGSLKAAREQLRLFANAANTHTSKINAFNESMEKMDKNVGNIVDKFEAWRAVMEGTSRGNDKARKSFGDLGREVDATGKAINRQADAQERAAKAQDALQKSADKLRNEYRELHRQEIKTDEDRAFTIARLQQIGRELDGISKRVSQESGVRRMYFDWARASKEAADSIIAEHKRITDDAKRQADLRVGIAKGMLEDLEKAEEARVKKAKQVTEDLAREDRRRIENLSRAEAERHQIQLRAHQQELRDAERDRRALEASERAAAVRGRLGVRSPLSSGERVDIKNTIKELNALGKAFGDDRQKAHAFYTQAEEISTSLRKLNRDLDRTGNVFAKLRSVINSNRGSIAQFDNQIRGMGLLAAVTFAQQLITVLGGLAGGFVAVASSAAQAGAAIGGSFVAGIGQALPSIGLLTGALMRVKGVMDVVKQAQNAQQQSAVQAATAGRRVADANDSVREAQERLTKARKEAKEDLDDLIQAEKDAALAAAGAALSQKEAQQALISAQARGDTAGIQRAQLRVLEAQADAEQAITDKRRARAESERGRRGGVGGAEPVVQAQQQLETAKRNAQEAAAGTETAVATLNYLLSQLSPAERRLYQALTNIQEAYKRTYRPITDLIIDSFTRSVNRVAEIIQMPKVVDLARKTATQLSNQMNRVFDGLTTDKMINQFIRIGEAGEKNLKPIADAAIDLGKAFANIAESAGPSFGRMLRFVGGLVDDFAKMTENRRGLREFFNEGEKHFESWIKLGLSVIDLFMALAGAGGAQTGVNLVNDATKAIDNLTKKVNDNKGKVAEFFEDSRHIVHEVVGVIATLAVELEKSFTPERVDNFAKFLNQVVIPALGDVIGFLGDINAVLVAIADTPFGEDLLKFAFAFVILGKVFSSLFGWVAPVIGWFLKFAAERGAFTKIVDKFFDLAKFARPIGLVALRFLGIVGAVVALLHWLGLLDDAWDAIKSGFNAFWTEVKPSLDNLIKVFKDLWESVSEGEGIFGLWFEYLQKVFGILIDIGGVFARVFGRLLGRVLGGAADLLAGFVEILDGIFSFDADKILHGIETIVKGIVKIFFAIPNALKDLGVEIGKAIFGGLKGVGTDIVNALIDIIETAWNKTIGGLGFHKFGLNIEIPEIKIPRMKEAAEDTEKFSKAVDNTATSAKNLKDEQLDKEFDDIAESADKVGKAAKTQEHQNKVATDSIATNWKNLNRSTKVNLDQIRNTVATNMRTIKDRMDEDSNAGRAAIKENFERAIRAVHRSMRNGVTSVKEGNAEIRRLMISELKSLGLTNQQAKAKVDTGTLQDLRERVPGGGGYRATGGFINMQGQRGRDKGSYALGDGEAVLNWAHQKYIAPAVEYYYGHPFSKTFDRVHAYHAGGPGQLGFAAGTAGMASLFDGHPSGVVGGLVNLVRKIKEQFPSLIVTSTTDHGVSTSTGGLSDHPSGHAVDIAGDTATMAEAASWIKASGIAGNLKQGIHNPNLSINRGVQVPESFWGVAWGQHANHLHLALEGALGKVANVIGGIVQLPRVIFEGMPGAIQSVMQRSVDIVHSAAQDRVEQIVASMDSTGLDLDPGDFKGGGDNASNIALGKRMAAAYGWTGAQFQALKQLWHGESNWNHLIRNASSGATGIPQALPGSKMASAGADWATNPATQIAWGLGYIRERYGDPIQALAAWMGRSPHWYAEGGEIPGMRGMPVPIIAHAREWVLNEFQQTRLAKMMGTHRHALKSMLGFHGGPVAFQGGGEVEEITPLSTKDVKGIDLRSLRRLVVVLRRIGRNIDNAATGMASVEVWSNYLDKSSAQLRRLTNRLGAKIAKGDESTALKGFLDGMDKLLGETGPFAKMREAIERQAARADTRLQRQSLRVRQLPFGRGLSVTRRDEVGIARRELEEERRQRPQLVEERDDIRRSLRDVRRQQRRKGLSDEAKQRLQAQENQLVAMRDEADKRVVDNLTAISEAQTALAEAQAEKAEERKQKLRDALDKVQAAYERELGVNEFARRVATALGQDGVVAQLNQAQADILTRQANDLESRIQGLRNAGLGAEADELVTQVQDLRTQVVEIAQQALRESVDAINNASQKKLAGLDLAGRMLDAMGAVGLGGVASLAGVQGGGAFTRGGILAKRGEVLQDTRARLEEARTRAAGEMNEGLVRELNDQIEELTVQIAENTQATYRAKLDDVNRAASFGLNVKDLEKQIIELEGGIAGQIDQSKILANLQSRGLILEQQRVELDALLADAQARGDVAAMEELQVALLENRVAVLQNTKAVNEQTGVMADPQTFSSSAWQWFGEAIFTGMGQVLPQYNMATGMGAGAMGGINTGAVVVPSVTTSQTTGGDVNITVNEAGGPVDVQEISGIVTYASKTAQ